MIRKLHRLAQYLSPFLPVITLVGLLALALVGLSVVDNPWLDSDRYLMPSLIFFGWALTLFGIAVSFRAIPDEPSTAVSFRQRMGLRVQWAMLWLVAALMVLLAVAMLVLSYQLTRAWFMNY